MDNIKDIIHTVIGNMASKTPDIHNKSEKIWKNLLNEQELKHTKVNGIKDGNLFVDVDSPAWLHQMRIRQFKLLKTIQEEIPDIKSIRFKIGTIK